MLCDKCHKKPAIIHIQQVMGEVKKSLHLCGECAAASGILNMEDENVDLSAMLYDFTTEVLQQHTSPVEEKEEDEADLTCSVCGLTTSDFRKTGKLGCSHCYEAFKTVLGPVLEEVHRGKTHKGKRPSCNGERVVATILRPDLHELQRELDQAIASEAYERAAELRDEIHIVVKSQKGA